VQRGEISGIVTLSGEIRPRSQQMLTARVSGLLDRLLVDLGSLVQEGQALAEIDRASFDLRAVQSEASLATAEARHAALLAGSSSDETAQAEAVLRGARARLDALEKQPAGDAPDVLLQKLQAARQRVASLEAGSVFETGRADATVTAARNRVEQLQRESNSAQNQNALAEARQALRQAEEHAAASRRTSNAEELARARQELLSMQDQLLLARTSIGQAELEAARAAVEAAEIGLKRAGSGRSEAEIKAALAEVQRAQMHREVARIQAREATIVAPFAGMISEVHAPAGTLVAPGTPVLTLVPPNYEVVVPFPELQIGQVAVGQPVKVGVDAYQSEEFVGTVRSVAPVVDPRTRTVAVRVEVSDPGYKLKSGMYAQLAIASPARRGTLLVPREAVVGRSGELSVFQVIDGKARRQPIQAGATDGRAIEILAGAAEGVEVVLSPSAQADGATVR
jgi:membrane fusion protein (multidrug efflux system)